MCLCMYVFITVHVQGVGVCWCVCAIGDAIFVRLARVCVPVSVVHRLRVRNCRRRIRVYHVIILLP